MKARFLVCHCVVLLKPLLPHAWMQHFGLTWTFEQILLQIRFCPCKWLYWIIFPGTCYNRDIDKIMLSPNDQKLLMALESHSFISSLSFLNWIIYSPGNPITNRIMASKIKFLSWETFLKNYENISLRACKTFLDLTCAHIKLNSRNVIWGGAWGTVAPPDYGPDPKKIISCFARVWPSGKCLINSSLLILLLLSEQDQIRLDHHSLWSYNAWQYLDMCSKITRFK